MKFSLALAALVAAPGALAHMRFKCPAARNTNTGLKVGPCGSQGVGAAARVALSPGWQTITIEESIRFSVTQNKYYYYYLLVAPPFF
jgi:hypothetical protein